MNATSRPQNKTKLTACVATLSAEPDREAVLELFIKRINC